MRILLLYAHPVETSYGAALHAQVVAALRPRHEIDDCDLYREGFDPVLSRQDRIDYHNLAVNRARVAPYVDRLIAAQALVLVFPVWNYGFPAIMKGFVDRVFLPGVAFELSEAGDYTPTLRHVKKLGAVCTYGGDRWRTILAGDPPRRVVKRMLRSLVDVRATCDYLALHDMNHPSPQRRERFLGRVSRVFEAW